MKGNHSRSSVLVMGLLVALLAGLPLRPGSAAGMAQESEPEANTQPQAPAGAILGTPLGTAFTYQGRLQQDGSLVDGTCDLQFSLWDALEEGNQIGSLLSQPAVSVAGGTFTVQLDFGSGAFQGDARWLAIAVCCPSGCDPKVTLTPRQPLTAAPYALALPGLWTQQNATSPNLIGGYAGNIVGPDAVGAVIGGGGRSGYPNTVTDDYGTVGGGAGNIASGWTATIGGGGYNAADGYASTVGGGYESTASGVVATVGGGEYNTASGADATVGGGSSNTASGASSTIGGG